MRPEPNFGAHGPTVFQASSLPIVRQLFAHTPRIASDDASSSDGGLEFPREGLVTRTGIGVGGNPARGRFRSGRNRVVIGPGRSAGCP